MARLLLGDWASIDPTDPLPWEKRAELELWQGNIPAALQVADSACQLCPEDQGLKERMNLIRCQARDFFLTQTLILVSATGQVGGLQQLWQVVWIAETMLKAVPCSREK